MRSVTGGNGLAGKAIQVFGIGTDHVLHHITVSIETWDTGWTSHFLNAPPLQSIELGRRVGGNLEVFGVGKDDRLHHTAQFATSWQNYWTAPFDDAGVPIRSVSLGTDGQGDLNVFVVR